MPPKKPRTCKNGLNYDYLIHYMKHDAYPPSVKAENEKRNIRKRAKSFRLEQLDGEDKLHFIFTDEENVTHEKEVVYKPDDQRRVFNQYHVNKKGMHLGREKLLNMISEKFYWPGICQGIKEYLKECKACRHKAEIQTAKRYMLERDNSLMEVVGMVTKNEEEVRVEIPMESDLSGVSFSDSWITTQQQQFDPIHFWDIVEARLLGPYPCNGRLKHVLVFMDVMSLWPEAAIVETMSPTVVTHVLLNLICRFGVMNKLILPEAEDEGNILIPPRTDILSASNIDIEIRYGNVPQTAVAWAEIEETMNHFVSSNSDWVNCVNFALLPHRISRGRQSEYSPAFLTYGRELRIPEHLTHQTTAESLQTSDTYITIDKKIDSLNSLMSVYKGYKGSVNISQDSDTLKTASTRTRHRPNTSTGPTPVRLTAARPYKSVNSRTGSTNNDRNSIVVNDDADNPIEVQIKQEVEDEVDLTDSGFRQEVEDEADPYGSRCKRWSKTHRTSMDNSSNGGDLSLEELQWCRKLLDTDGSNQELMECDDTDAYYERVVLYLKDKKYASGVTTEHLKRSVRKTAERHYLEKDILYHKWKMSSQAVPLRQDERYYILEHYHIDSEGRHANARQMEERLSPFYWKTMAVDCEAFVRSCVQCNQSISSEMVRNDYNFNDEKRAKLAEENYSLLVKYLQKGKLGQTIPPNKSQLIELLSKWFVIKSGQLYYHKPDRNEDVCVEIAARAQKNAIRDAHIATDEKPHASQSDTLQKLGGKYIWHGMKESCEEFVRTCCKLPRSKKNNMFIKYDLNQRIEQFHRLREMIQNPKPSNRNSNLSREEVLQKYQTILNKNDKASKSKRLDMSDSFAQTEVDDSGDEMATEIEHTEQLSVTETESTDPSSPNGRGLNKHHDIEHTGSDELKSSQDGQRQGSDIFVAPENIVKGSKTEGSHGDKTLDGNPPSSLSQYNIQITVDNLGINSEVVDKQKIFSSAVTQEHQYTTTSSTDNPIHDDLPQSISSGHGDLPHSISSCHDSLPSSFSGGNDGLPPSISSIHDGSSNQTVLVTLPDPPQTKVNDPSVKPSIKYDDRRTQTSYSKVLSDEVTLSAVRSILPEEEEEGDDDAEVSDENDPDWKADKETDDVPTSIEPCKELHLELKKIKYDNKTKYRCKVCGKCIKGAVRYRTHMYGHTGVKPFVCDVCPKRFTTLKTKKIHMLRHTADKRFLCYLCGKGFSTDRSLKSHIAVHEKGGNIMVKCELCPRIFRTRNRFEKHMKFKHPYTPDVYRCDECDKNFTTRRSLVRHNKSQHQKVKGHICDTCGKGFYRKEYLKSHLITHQPVRPQRPYIRKNTSEVTTVKHDQSDVHVQNTSQYSNHLENVTETVVESINVPSDYAIPLTEGHPITLPNSSESHHIALPSTTVENQMTVESTFYIAHPDEDNQVAHMLVYEQPAVQYEVECGESGEQLDAAEALTAINILAQASISQEY